LNVRLGRQRCWEDECLDERSPVTNAHARLTLTGPSREATFGTVLLFRSRFCTPASLFDTTREWLSQKGRTA
jgi:hypothetical protein